MGRKYCKNRGLDYNEYTKKCCSNYNLEYKGGKRCQKKSSPPKNLIK